jgi:hypothetical protein
MHLDFESAFYYNMGSFIVLPLVGLLWIKWGIQEFKFLAKAAKNPSADNTPA